MTRISLYEHPLAVVAPKVFEVESLAQWIVDHFAGLTPVQVQVFAGEPSADTEITDDIAALIEGGEPHYTVLQSPGDPGSWTLATWLMIGTAVAVATVLLMPKPVMPGNINRTQSSPNNSLSGRENKVRLLERIEDIYGTVKSIPSLLMPTYNKYKAHKKYEYGYYCVGRGYHALADIKDGDTLISDITGAAVSVYDPFTSPNSGAPALTIGDAIDDDVITATRAIEVDGLTLKALNQIQLPASAAYTFTAGGTLTQAAKQPNLNAVVGVGEDITVSMADQTVIITPAVYDSADPPNLITPAVTATRNYSGTYEVNTTTDGGVTLAGTSWSHTFDVTCSVQVAGVSEYTDWVTLPADNRTQVWCNVTAPNGMFKDSGGKSAATVAFAIEIEKLHATSHAPLGIVETVTGELSGSVTDERAVTVEQTTAWTGPCRVRMRRTTQYDYAFGGSVQDEIKWVDLTSVSPVDKAHFGNVTTIHTITKATPRATAVKSRQLNCIASRLLPVFDGTSFSGAFDSTGLHVSGVLYPTSKLVDIIAAVSVDPMIGRRNLAAEIDMAQIWSIQQELDAWSAEAGQFSYTFDSDNTSFEETLTLIANAGFCVCYRQNGKIRLAFDKLQTASSALFTHRNKKPRSETITHSFAADANYDGVQFVYVDPDINTSETISLPLDGSATKYKKFEIAGIRSFAQAWYRANREYAKLRGQRLSMDTTTTLDARSLLPNARISVVDNTRFKSYDGEIVGQSGLTVTLSQSVEFTPSASHSIILMRRDGSLQSIPCTATGDPQKVVLQSLPSEAIVTSYGAEGIRTIYSFAADSARAAQAWLVQEIDISDQQYCQIKAINYSPAYYAADTLTVPDKASIIN